jgi:hypothetical protein
MRPNGSESPGIAAYRMPNVAPLNRPKSQRARAFRVILRGLPKLEVAGSRPVRRSPAPATPRQREGSPSAGVRPGSAALPAPQVELSAEALGTAVAEGEMLEQPCQLEDAIALLARVGHRELA